MGAKHILMFEKYDTPFHTRKDRDNSRSYQKYTENYNLLYRIMGFLSNKNV